MMARDYLCLCDYCLSTNSDGKLVSQATYFRHQKSTQGPSLVQKWFNCQCSSYPNSHRFRSKASYHRHLQNIHHLAPLDPEALISEPRDATNIVPSYVNASSSEHVDTGDPIDTALWSDREYTLDTSDASDVPSNKDMDGDVNEEIEGDIDDNVVLDEDEACHRDRVAAYVDDDTLATAECDVNVTNEAGLYSTI